MIAHWTESYFQGVERRADCSRGSVTGPRSGHHGGNPELTRKLRQLFFVLIGFALVGGGVTWALIRTPSPDRTILPFPVSKSCALSITDDTDFFQFRTTKPVYDLLNRFGARVTKTVWVFDDPGSSPEKEGLSLVNETYREWVEEQHRRGHEITLHTAGPGDDTRAQTLAAYDSLRSLLGGAYPRLDIFHSDNLEAFYWGADRLPSPLLRWLYAGRRQRRFEGSDPESPYYWVDVSRQRIRYVRTYTFNDIDTWAVNPSMPYEDPATPGAPLWFASSNGRWGDDFVRLVRPENIGALKRAHGVSVIYVHLATGFDTPEAMAAMARCAGDPEIEFVPAGEVLDRLRLIQLVRARIEAGDTRWSLPLVLQPELANISVRPRELAGAFRMEEADCPERMGLQEWLGKVDVELEWVDGSVFPGAERISGREKWRLVARWLWTQMSSPT